MLRDLAKKKVVAVVDGQPVDPQREAAYKAIHKSPEELMEMAEQYSGAVAAGTTAAPKIVGNLGVLGKNLEENTIRKLIKQYGPKVSEALDKTLESGMSSPKARAEFMKKIQESLLK